MWVKKRRLIRTIFVLLVLSLLAGTAAASAYEFDGLFSFMRPGNAPGAEVKTPVQLGVGDDGRTIAVDRGAEVQFTFVEYGHDDSWVMRSNPDVAVISDLVLESYPMQRKLTLKVMAPTTVYFDRKVAKDGGKTSLIYQFIFDGKQAWNPGSTVDNAYVPDPTFDNPPVIISTNRDIGWPENSLVVPGVFRKIKALPNFL